MEAFSPEGLQKLRKLMTENEDIYKLVTGTKKSGRPKGAKGSNTIQEGKVIEIVKPTEVENAEEPIPISQTQAKKLLQATRKPRVISEENRAKMLENLQKGRDKLKSKKEEQKKAEEQKKKAEEDKAKKEVVIKKYVVKPKKNNKRKFQSTENDNESEVTEREIATEDFTEGETDIEIYKKLKRQERLLKKIEQVKKSNTQSAPRMPSNQYRPPFQQARAPNPFFY